VKNKRGIIFDLDGTLYHFKGGDGSFGASDFYADLRQNMTRFLASRLDISGVEAQREYARIKDQYNGEVSLGVEKELGIDRYEWFGNTWNLEPAGYISSPGSRLAESLVPFSDRSLVLTAAPAAWAKPVLTYLGISDIFGERVITGEPDVRKPNPAIFRRAAHLLQRRCCEVISIGDQNESDILPAKALGMLTIKVDSASMDADYCADSIYGAIDTVAFLDSYSSTD